MPRRRPAVLGRPGRHGHGRLPPPPVPRRPRSTASGIPGFALQRRPAGRGHRQRHLLPRVAWPAARPGTPTSRSASATRSAGSCAPSGADLYGGVCVNVLRHPAWGRAQETYGEDPHHVGELGAALTRGVQRHVMACVKHFACNSMENARFKVDVTVDDAGAARGVPAALQADRRRGRRLGHERLQRGQRRVVRPEPRAAHATCCAASGASRASSSATGSSGCATPARRSRAGLDVEMPVPHGPRRTGLDARPGRRRGHRGRRRRLRSPARRRHPAALRTPCSPAPIRPIDVLASPEPPRRWRGRRRPRRSCCCATSRSTARRCCRSTRPALERVAVLGRLADAATSATAARATSGPSTVVTPLDGLRAALAGRRRACSTHDATRRSPPAPTWPSSWSATPSADEGEFIGDAGTADLAELLPGRRRPGRGGGLRGAGGGRGPRSSRPGSARTDAGGFSTGGDRASLRLVPSDEALIPAVAAANPRTVVAVDRRQRRAHRGVAPRRPRHRAGSGTPAWRAATRSPTCCSARVDASGRLPFTVPTDADAPPAVRPRRRRPSPTTAGTATGTSRATATRPPSRSASACRYTTLALGPHHARRRRRRPRRPGHACRTPATATAPTSCRSTPAVRPTRPARPVGSWPSPGSTSPPGRTVVELRIPWSPSRRAGGRCLDPRPRHLRPHRRSPQRRPRRRRPHHRPPLTHPTPPNLRVEVRQEPRPSTAGSDARARGRRGWRRRPSRRACGGGPR